VNEATEIEEITKITETETTGITAAMAGTPRQIGILTEATGVIGGLAPGTAQERTETVHLVDVQTT